MCGFEINKTYILFSNLASWFLYRTQECFETKHTKRNTQKGNEFFALYAWSLFISEYLENILQ